MGQKGPPRLGSTICYGQELARKSHRAICYGQELARKSHRDSAVRFVAAKNLAIKRTTKTRQYDLFRPRVGQKEPPRLGSTICYGQTWARKSHQDSAIRVVTAKTWPERATKTRQSYLFRRRVNQKEPPRPASTIRYGQKWARKNHQDSAVRFVTAKHGPRVGQNDSAVRFVTAKSGPERGIKIRQFDLLRPRVGQKEPTRLGSTMFYSQECARKSRQDSAVRFVVAKSGPERATKTRQAVRFVTAKSGPERAAKIRQYDLLRPRVWPERATKTRQYDLLRPNVGHRDSAVRFVTAKNWPERATKTRQYALLLPRVGQKKPPRLGSAICYGQTWARKSHQDSAVRYVTDKRVPEKATQDSAVRFVTAKSWPERAIKTRQYDLLRSDVGQKEPPRLGSTICYGQTWARKSHQDSAVRFVTAKNWPERATKTGQYYFLRPNVGQKEPPRLDSTICYGQTWARKRHEDSAVRFVTAKSWPERATSAVRCVTVKRGPERATEIRQYDLLRPNVGQKEPPRLGSTICYGQTWARKNHQDSAVRFSTANRKSHRDPAVRFVAAKRGPERATKTRQYDLLRPNVGQKEPPRLGSTICYGKTWARKSHQDSAVRFITAKRGPERATETRQYDLLRPNVGQKEPPRLGSTICYGQTWARKSHQDSAV